jgi:hypothetical protein
LAPHEAETSFARAPEDGMAAPATRRISGPAGIREGLEAYNRNGLIHGHTTQADARAAIVSEWK